MRERLLNPVAGALAALAACGACDGETLYNGITLPREWPPRVDIRDKNPVRTPYLDAADIPKVIPIDVGRQLFVDDFLVASTSGVRRVFFKPRKYHANATKRRVTWRGGDLSRFAGKAMRFRFKMKVSTLYAFWVAQKPTGESGGYVAAGGPAYRGLKDE